MSVRRVLNSYHRCYGNAVKGFRASWFALLIIKPYVLRLVNNFHDAPPHQVRLVLDGYCSYIRGSVCSFLSCGREKLS